MASESAPGIARFRQALLEALAAPGISAPDADLAGLRSLASSAHAALEAAGAGEPEAIAALRVISLAEDLDGAAERAADMFDGPEELQVALFLALCLSRDANPALRLLSLRRYIEEASVPESYPELWTDRQAVLDSTTFRALMEEPEKLGWMEGVAAIWRRDYAVQYVKSHTTHNAVLNEIAQMAEDVEPQARAPALLNTLVRLGPPAGRRALGQLHDLAHAFVCAANPAAVNHDLESAPRCSSCEYRLTGRTTRAEMRVVVRAIERALSTQLARLSRRVVARLLARGRPRPADKVEQFLRVVPASDLTGLATVLDDDLLAFLAELLAEGEGDDILAELALAYPVVTASNIDAAVAEFRRVLADRLRSSDAWVSLERTQQ